MESKNLGSLHVNITGDDSDLQEALDRSEKELNKATESVREFGTNIGLLRAEYKKLSKESFAGKTPQEIEAIEMRLASLRDEIGDYDARIKSLSADPFQKGAEAVQQLSTMLAGAAGAATLFGGSEEELNKLMQKTIALIAIAQAAQTAADFTKQNAIGIFIKEKYVEIAARIKEGLTIKANTASTIAETGAKTGLTAVQKILIALQNTWNKAMQSSPIFLLIGAIAAITVGVIALTKALSTNSSEFDKANESAKKLEQTIDRINKDNKYLLETERAFGATSDELNKKRISQIESEIAKNDELIRQLQKLSSERGIFSGKTDRAKEAEAKFIELQKKNTELFRESMLLRAEMIGNDIKLKNEAAKKEQEIEKAKLVKMKADYVNFLEDLYNKGYQGKQKTTIDVELDLEMPSPEELFGQVDEVAVPLINKYKDITELVNEEIEKGLENLTVSLAESAGLLATGETNMKGVFKSIGKVLADFMGSLGKSLIATGIASKTFKSALSNPYAAVAAGAALVALSAVVASKLGAGPSGAGMASTSMNAGGGVSGGGTEYRTIFANERQMQIVGELRADGNQLVAALYNENKRVSN